MLAWKGVEVTRMMASVFSRSRRPVTRWLLGQPAHLHHYYHESISLAINLIINPIHSINFSNNINSICQNGGKEAIESASKGNGTGRVT
jgi:hypothetical protein